MLCYGNTSLAGSREYRTSCFSYSQGRLLVGAEEKRLERKEIRSVHAYRKRDRVMHDSKTLISRSFGRDDTVAPYVGGARGVPLEHC